MSKKEHLIWEEGGCGCSNIDRIMETDFIKLNFQLSEKELSFLGGVVLEEKRRNEKERNRGVG